MTIIEVTQEDIDKGHRIVSDKCPIALGVMRAMGAERASIGYPSAAVFRDGVCDNFVLPKRALNFIEKFDAGRPVKPFSFRIPLTLPKC